MGITCDELVQALEGRDGLPLPIGIAGSNRIWYLVAAERRADGVWFRGYEPCCHYGSGDEGIRDFPFEFLAQAAALVRSTLTWAAGDVETDSALAPAAPQES